MAWLSGLMESRGISHVSAIILAMVSNVEDIGNSLVDLEFLASRRPPRLDARNNLDPHSHQLAIGCPYSEA